MIESEIVRETAGTRWKGGRKEKEMIESEIVREAAGTRWKGGRKEKEVK